ncbi:Atp-Binding Cassette Sub-Family A Member 9 [Manis pentadactyla]|nr:Atp-Binding Cassette Sub-Family A Member 9 [Manis pentadactyla]
MEKYPLDGTLNPNTLMQLYIFCRKQTDPETLREKRLILCNTAWPQCQPGDREKYTLDGTLNPNTLMQLDIFCNELSMWAKIPLCSSFSESQNEQEAHQRGSANVGPSLQELSLKTEDEMRDVVGWVFLTPKLWTSLLFQVDLRCVGNCNDSNYIIAFAPDSKTTWEIMNKVASAPFMRGAVRVIFKDTFAYRLKFSWGGRVSRMKEHRDHSAHCQAIGDKLTCEASLFWEKGFVAFQAVINAALIEYLSSCMRWYLGMGEWMKYTSVL